MLRQTFELVVHILPNWSMANTLHPSQSALLTLAIQEHIVGDLPSSKMFVVSNLGGMTLFPAKIKPFYEAVYADLGQARLLSQARKAVRVRFRYLGWGLVVAMMWVMLLDFLGALYVRIYRANQPGAAAG